MKPIPAAWLMSKMDLPENCAAGVPPALTPADIKDGWELTPEDRSYSAGEPCPRCGKAMTYDDGERETRSHPGVPPSVGCDDCGDEYAVRPNVSSTTPR